jgi:hypothetical protein
VGKFAQPSRQPVPIARRPWSALDLRGAVGNRAMGRLLARRPRSLPTDPTKLEDYRPVLTQLKIDTDIQSLGALNRFFREKGGRFATRDGFSVNFNRSPDLDTLAAKVPVVCERRACSPVQLRAERNRLGFAQATDLGPGEGRSGGVEQQRARTNVS